ncbi:MAG: N-acetylmuramoyl-L-alanine amidase [Rhodobacterales bacterium]|nr:N-acetylmuramoyl-L-alanine amidase [Rhodobacterales bacterium]
MRRGGVRPVMVVIHYTGMDSAEAALDRLCDPAAEVSAHYLIAASGAVFALVPEAMRAWHAGAGRWGSVTDVNSASIGIELANTGRTPYAAAQMRALEQLLAGVMARHGIAPERVIGHSDMAPLRKADPGARFDWLRLARQRLSVWPDPRGAVPAPDAAAFDAAAVTFGYDPDIAHDTRLAAFRLRFRPWAAGPVGSADMATITDLARRYPAL